MSAWVLAWRSSKVRLSLVSPLVVAVGVERRVDVDQVNATIGQLGELFEVVAAVDDARVDERRRPPRWCRGGFSGLLGSACPISRRLRHRDGSVPVSAPLGQIAAVARLKQLRSSAGSCGGASVVESEQ